MGAGKVVLGVVAGLAAGVALGMLYAPAKGTATRRKIVRQGNGYANDVKDGFHEVIDTVSDQFETMASGVGQWVDGGPDRKKAK